MTAPATITPAMDATTGGPERIWFLGALATVHVPAEAGLGFSLVEMSLPEDEQTPLHVHRNDDEGFYVLEGRVTVWYGDRRLELEPGDFALAPRDVPHTYRVESPEGARILVTSSDASFDRFVRAYGEPATELRLPDPEAPDVERLGALATEHGIEILGPPGALPS